MKFLEGFITVNKLKSRYSRYKGVNAWMESFIFFFLYPSYWKFLPSPTARKFREDLSNLAKIERDLFRKQQENASDKSFLKMLSTIVDDETGQMCR